jgi:DMSO/TMAO reductase YedYZ molybdopterin-dependent catalytic subunit
MALCCGLAVAAASSAQDSKTLTVSGNVAQTLALTIADLKRYPAHHVDYLPGNSAARKASIGETRRYTGCLLREVLAAARPIESKPRALRRSYVVAGASDDYEVVFSWAELFVSPLGDNVYVVYERDGASLPDDEGPIALIAVTDTQAVRHVKWLRSLRLRTE